MALVVTSFIGYGIGLVCGFMMKKTDELFPKTTNKEKSKKRTYTKEELTFGYSFGDGGSDCL